MLVTLRRQQQALKGASQTDETTMPILMDNTLRQYADQAYETARLGRNDVHTPHEQVSAEVLAELEATGCAMRFVDCRGKIAWKTTPQLRDYLMDLQLDAEADLEDV